MNPRQKQLFRALLLSGALALTVPQAALALTPACTKIDNRAVVNYTVGGVPQTALNSLNGNNGNANEATSFYVGVKVDVSVAKQNNSVPTYGAGSTVATMTFRVTNNGNASMLYDLTAANLATGTASPVFVPAVSQTDNFQVTFNTINGIAANPATTATAVAPGTFIDVPVVVTIPAIQVNNDLSVVSLIAQSKFPGTGTISVTSKNSTATGNQIGNATYNTICTVAGPAGPATTNLDVVAADIQGTDDASANDGASSDRNAVQVLAAGLSIVKTSTPYWDPVNLFVNPKAIPGAIMTYTITVTNTIGASTASNIQIVDSLDGPITGGQLVFGGATPGKFDNSNDVGGVNCAAGSGILVNGACKTNTYSGNDGASFNDDTDPALVAGQGNRVVASGLSVTGVAGGNVATIKYQTVIQ